MRRRKCFHILTSLCISSQRRRKRLLKRKLFCNFATTALIENKPTSVIVLWMTVWIDHVLASGAVVGRATTHEWSRPSLRMQRGAGLPHDHLGRSNQTMWWLKQNYPQLNRYHHLQVKATFPREYIAIHAWWRHNVKHPREEKLSSEHISQRF